MNKIARITLVILAVLTWSKSYAQDSENLIGLWRLISYELEFQDTGERQTPFGAHPNGYGVITPEGRTMAVLTAEGRPIPKSDADRAAAFKTVIAYTGMLKVDGDHWTTHVDVTWNEAWNGTDQVRFFNVDGDTLSITSAWSTNLNYEGRLTRGVLKWERVR
jgi:hypothetical protein